MVRGDSSVPSVIGGCGDVASGGEVDGGAGDAVSDVAADGETGENEVGTISTAT